MSELRVALVTGSGKKRVGFEVARLLGHAGYKLILHYRSSREEALESIALLQREGLSAHALAADLSRETEVQALVQEQALRGSSLPSRWPAAPHRSFRPQRS